jgi:hypothetical protein
MLPLQIKRHRYTNVDPKKELRAHIARLPVAKQREFVLSAFQLIAKRTGMSEAEMEAKYRQLLQPQSIN